MKNSTLILIVGDLLVILSFVWIGRGSHSLPVSNLMAGLLTALPFVAGWFLIVPWLGIYRDDISRSWQRLAPRLLLGWALAGSLALVLRTLLLGRPIVGGIIFTFAVVSLGYIGIVALFWRLAYMGWVNRKRDGEEARGSSL